MKSVQLHESVPLLKEKLAEVYTPLSRFPTEHERILKTICTDTVYITDKRKR